jgi:hypothetical protein
VSFLQIGNESQADGADHLSGGPVSVSPNGSGPLRRELATAMAAHGCSMKALTVLSEVRDPYRLDTPARHRDGRWFAKQVDRFVGGSGQIHLRGLHYKISSPADIIRPNGLPYVNDNDCWEWLGEFAAKAGRWLQYVGFDRIGDERNEKPFLFVPDNYFPDPEFHSGASPVIPELKATTPHLLAMDGFVPRQKYRIILIGEKSSLKNILLPIAEMIGGELLLPTGESSHSMILELAARIAVDGRPAVILYFSDFDPSGRQMAVSVARTLQAARTLLYPAIKFELHAVALTLTQVQRFRLPSTPLKESERRGDRWREVMGHEQTEIDAMLALAPEQLDRIARQSIQPFFDATLKERAEEAARDWSRAAAEAVQSHPAYADAAQVIADRHEELLTAAQALREAQDDAYEALRDVEVPEIEVPEAELTIEPPTPLFTTEDDFYTATRHLIQHKALET